MTEKFKPIIIDNFYQNPDEVRDFACGQKFRKTKLIGTDSLVTYKMHPEWEFYVNKISELIDVKPDIERIKSNSQFWGFAGCGEFQLRYSSLQRGKKHIHKTGAWTGIIYLSKNIPDNQVGTYFYKHKETGISHLNETDDNLRLKLKEEQKDSLWEVHSSPSFKYNRLILFDSRYYHSESEGFGSNPKDGRLIQIFNF